MKFLKSFLVAVVIVTTAAACNNGPVSVKPGDIVFEATIEGAPNMQILVLSSNPFDMSRDTLRTDAQGKFSFKKHLNNGEYFEVLVGSSSRFPLFLLPGDTTFMTANLNNFFDSQSFSGTAAIYNNYLTDYTKQSQIFQKEVYQKFSLPEAKAVQVIDSVRDAREKNYDDFIKANTSAVKVFRKYEEARVLYEWALLRNIYPLYFRYLNKTEFEPSPEYMSYLGALDINDSSLLSLDLYQTFLDSYVGSKMEEYYKNDSLREANPSSILYRLKMIDKIFTDKSVKSVMAFKSVVDFIRYDGIKDYDLYIDYFHKLCPYKAMQVQVNNMLAEWKQLKKGMPAYEFTFEDIDGNKVSMSDFKGKYVYVDVWATWCSPCRKEIPYLKKMEEDFKGKNIAFVSISVDQTKDPWKAMVVNDTLKGYQLWAGQAREFSEFYKITGIPRFMLFDKDGKILESSATRPSGGVDKQLAKLPGI